MSEPVLDLAAERHMLAAVLAEPSRLPDVLSLVGPDDLSGLHPALMTVLIQMSAHDDPIEPMRVHAAMRRAGHTAAEYQTLLTDLLTRENVVGPSATWYAQRVARAAGLRHFQQMAVRIDQAATSPDAEPEGVADLIASQLAKLDQTLSDGTDNPDALDLIRRDLSVEWLVPGLLARSDRLILVGHEGHGKSLYLAQTAACLAAGLHPWTQRKIDPVKVLLVDAENDAPEVTRRLDILQAACIQYGRPIERGQLTYVEREYGIDLLSSIDATWLLRTVASVQPDVLVIGPMYQIVDGDLAKEEVSAKLKVALNRARARARCAVLMEAHVGHEDQGGKRPIRPYGSSMWRRWAGIGHALKPDPDTKASDHIYRLTDYRGRRSRRPDWPSHVMWNPNDDGFPWIPGESSFYSNLKSVS
jgi:hypothetical protein